MKYSFTSAEQTQRFLKHLKQELAATLPGVEAHLRLAPEIRIQGLKTGDIAPNAMQSAVLILLYPVDGSLKTVVILRNEYDGMHSGQISLPGGKAEDTDIDFEYTALREAHEEIGIDTSKIEIIGQLSRFYVRPSNFIVYPFVGFCWQQPLFSPDPVEVQRIIEIDIFDEIRYDKIISRTLTFKNHASVTAPGFVVGGEFMWGATAMMISELIQVLNQAAEKSA
ncbi:MAG: CoA pyrophosphatase [Bacteroidales bacterium]